MGLRLRQIALVAAVLEPLVEALCDTFDVEVCHRDPGVTQFGLHNALMPFGSQFVEVVAPVREGTAGGRYLERRGGDGGYMVITQCDDFEARRRRIDELGLRLAFSFEVPGQFRNLQIHPKDSGGSFFEIDQQLGDDGDRPDGPWHPAGPAWQRARSLSRLRGITAAEIQADDPEALAARWASIAGLPVEVEQGIPTLHLDNASIRFVPCRDGRPEGLGGIDVAAVAPDLIARSAERHGAWVDDGERDPSRGRYGPRVELGGMRIRPITA